jgi:hypothetical protein
MNKKLFNIFLAIFMLFTLISFGAFAAGEGAVVNVMTSDGVTTAYMDLPTA